MTVLSGAPPPPRCELTTRPRQQLGRHKERSPCHSITYTPCQVPLYKGVPYENIHFWMKINRCDDELLQLDVNVKKNLKAASQKWVWSKKKQLFLLFVNINFECSHVDGGNITGNTLNMKLSYITSEIKAAEHEAALLWLSEALLCKLASEKHRQITSQLACMSNLGPLKSHQSRLRHWLCTFVYQRHFVMLPYAHSNTLAFIAFCFCSVMFGLLVCVHWGLKVNLPFCFMEKH